jgi:hypothetical protein
MTIKTDIGHFRVGRMQGGLWGTDFMDTDSTVDRLMYLTKVGDIVIGAVYEKLIEGDKNTNTLNTTNETTVGDTSSDTDQDTYAAYVMYKTEDINAGLLLKYYDYADQSDIGAENKADAGTWASNKGHADITTILISPYADLKFGPVGIKTELLYLNGEIDFDQRHDAIVVHPQAGNLNMAYTDADIECLAFNLEGSFDFGMGNVYGGYAYISGDDQQDRNVTPGANTIKPYGKDNEKSDWIGAGGDVWSKLWILAADEGSNSTLGNSDYITQGNLTQGVSATNTNNTSAGLAGYQIYYAGANVKPMESLSLDFIIGMANTADEMKNWDDEYGIEYDLTVNYSIMENLTYKAVVAYLDAGDFFKGDKTAAGYATYKSDDPISFFQELKLSF